MVAIILKINVAFMALVISMKKFLKHCCLWEEELHAEHLTKNNTVLLPCVYIADNKKVSHVSKCDLSNDSFALESL